MNNFVKKSFSWKSPVFDISRLEVSFWPLWECKIWESFASLKRFAQEIVTSLKLPHHVVLPIGYVFCKKSFWRTALCREIKNKNSNFRELRTFMGQFRAENHIFIFRALHVRPSFLRLSLECLPSIYVCFMFLKFWLNRFIKIAPDENVFFSLNSREIAANRAFQSKLEYFRGYMAPKTPAVNFQGLICLVGTYSDKYH